MASRSDYFKLGLFVVVATAIAVAAVLFLSTDRLFRKHIEVETYVDESVQTLEVGSPVKFRGVEVGDVREITFVRTMLAPEDPDFINYGRYVLIRMKLYADVFEDLTAADVAPVLRRLIQDGLRIRLTSQGLTGQTHLEVDYVDPEDSPPLKISWEPRTYYIPSAPSIITRLSQTIDRVFTQIEESDLPNLIADFDRFLVVATQTVQEARIALVSEGFLELVRGLTKTNERLQAVLAEPGLDSVPRDLSGAAAAVRALVDQASNEVGLVLADLRSTSQSLRSSAEEIEALATKSGLRSGIEGLASSFPALGQAAEELPKTLAMLSATLRRVERVFSGSNGDVDVVLDNLRIVSENLRALTEALKAFPGQILFGEAPAPIEGSPR